MKKSPMMKYDKEEGTMSQERHEKAEKKIYKKMIKKEDKKKKKPAKKMY